MIFNTIALTVGVLGFFAALLEISNYPYRGWIREILYIAGVPSVQCFAPQLTAPAEGNVRLVIARINGDRSATFTRSLASTFQDENGRNFRGLDIRTINWPISIPWAISREAGLAQAQQCSITWLKATGAQAVLWGEVLGSTSVRIYIRPRDESEFTEFQPLELTDGLQFAEDSIQRPFSSAFAAILKLMANIELVTPRLQQEPLEAVIETIESLSGLIPILEDREASAEVITAAYFARASNFMIRGNIEKEAEYYNRALADLRVSERFWRKDTHVENWAKVQINIGIAYRGVYTEAGQASQLRLARVRFNSVLSVFSKDRNRNDWALTKFNVAQLDIAQAEATGNLKLFQSALAHLDDLRSVISPEAHPEFWANIHDVRATAKVSMSREMIRKNVDEGEIDIESMLKMAIRNYEIALEFSGTPPKSIYRATVYYQLGLVYQTLGAIQQRIITQIDGLSSLRRAQSIWTREEYPALWATAEQAIADLLREMSEMYGSPELLAQALLSFKDAIAVFEETDNVRTAMRARVNYGIALIARARATCRVDVIQEALHQLRLSEAWALQNGEEVHASVARVNIEAAERFEQELGQMQSDVECTEVLSARFNGKTIPIRINPRSSAGHAELHRHISPQAE